MEAKTVDRRLMQQIEDIIDKKLAVFREEINGKLAFFQRKVDDKIEEKPDNQLVKKNVQNAIAIIQTEVENKIQEYHEEFIKPQMNSMRIRMEYQTGGRYAECVTDFRKGVMSQYSNQKKLTDGKQVDQSQVLKKDNFVFNDDDED